MPSPSTPPPPDNPALRRVHGQVREAQVYGVDVYVADTDDRLVSETSLTIRQADGVPGWVGILDCDLTSYADVKLELRRPGSSADCAVLFTIGGKVKGRTLIRGTSQDLAPLQ